MHIGDTGCSGFASTLAGVTLGCTQFERTARRGCFHTDTATLRGCISGTGFSEHSGRDRPRGALVGRVSQGAVVEPKPRKGKPRQEGKTPTMTALEMDALTAIQLAGLPIGVMQYQFSKPRRWRFDRAWPDHQPPVALELEGGTFQKGGGWHQSIQRYMSDCEKYSEAAVLGWVVIRATAPQVRSGQMLAWLTRALETEG